MLAVSVATPPAESTFDSRSELYRLQASMRSIVQSQRERDCGRMLCVEDDPEVRVRSEDGQPRAHFWGLLRCGHLWTCAPCSQRIRARQAKRIAHAVEYLGGTWRILTLTLRHDGSMPLKDTLRALKRAWRTIRQRRDLRDLWKEHATAPITTCEITYGASGWHPHLHVAYQVARELTDSERALFFERWQKAIVAELGMRGRPNGHGVHWSAPFAAETESERALYVAKLGIELEIADPGLAKRNVWDIARRAAAGDSRCYQLWVEYHCASKGLHALQLSPEASSAAKLGAMLHARDDEPERFEAVDIPIPTCAIHAMRAQEHRRLTIFADLLRAAELGGKVGVWKWIATNIPHVLLRDSMGSHVLYYDTG